MPRDVPMPQAPWRASLALRFERRGERTVLASRHHDGPLVVQKTFHPEGDAACHAVVVHPPGGIAGGDELALEVHAAAGARALLTTPGAGKWYRTSGPWARQHVRIHAADASSVEWLPQETLVFDGARADLRWEAHLADDAKLAAWDILCLGRTGSGERFARGAVALSLRVVRGGRSLWIERGLLEAQSPVLGAAPGLAGRTVAGTFLVSAGPIADDALHACRSVAPVEGEGAVTRMPDLLVARYRGDSSEAARRYFLALWQILRPHAFAGPAVEPRIWRT
jgi:urease accessory protein